MPYLVTSCIDEFLQATAVPRDARETADTRRNAIVELLEKKFEILDCFPTGSLVRGTGLKHVSDVDVILALHFSKHIDGRSPLAVLESVRAALSTYNAKIVKKNGQAVTLYFATWPNVDIVPAKRVRDGNGHVLHIGDANTGEWIPTNPAGHDVAMARLPVRARQLVRLMKCWNRAHSGYFQSFHIEQVVLAMPGVGSDLPWDEASWPWTFLRFFERALELTLPDTTISDAYEVDDWSALRSRLKTAYDDSLSAWYAVHSRDDYSEAIQRLGGLFGAAFPKYG
jgi:hypothetical protein